MGARYLCIDGMHVMVGDRFNEAMVPVVVLAGCASYIIWMFGGFLYGFIGRLHSWRVGLWYDEVGLCPTCCVSWFQCLDYTCSLVPQVSQLMACVVGYRFGLLCTFKLGGSRWLGGTGYMIMLTGLVIDYDVCLSCV